MGKVIFKRNRTERSALNHVDFAVKIAVNLNTIILTKDIFNRDNAVCARFYIINVAEAVIENDGGFLCHIVRLAARKSFQCKRNVLIIKLRDDKIEFDLRLVPLQPERGHVNRVIVVYKSVFSYDNLAVCFYARKAITVVDRNRSRDLFVPIYGFRNGYRCILTIGLLHRISIRCTRNINKKTILAERHILLIGAPIAIPLSIPHQPRIIILTIAFCAVRPVKRIRFRIRHIAHYGKHRRIACFKHGFPCFLFKCFRKLTAVSF